VGKKLKEKEEKGFENKTLGTNHWNVEGEGKKSETTHTGSTRGHPSKGRKELRQNRRTGTNKKIGGENKSTTEHQRGEKLVT